MKTLPRPSYSVGEVVDRIADGPKSSKVKTHRGSLQTAENLYVIDMVGGDITSHPRTVHGLTKDDHSLIAWAYGAHLSKKGTKARDIYDRIRSLAEGTCPLCRTRQVSALDHFLPKDSFPGLALQPSNLVPICDACNEIKLAQVATVVADQFLHPYFDDLGSFLWLRAHVVESAMAPVKFSVERQEDWDDVLHERVEKHFQRFQLAELYSIQVASLLGAMSQLFSNRPSVELRDLLLEMSESYRSNQAQPWLTMALLAWSESKWFCDGGWLA